MGQALVTLPDGKRARITFDSQEQLDATVNDLVKQAKASKLDQEFHNHPVSDTMAETGLHLATGAVASLAGGANYLGTLIASRDPEAAKAVQEETVKKLTYEPKTKGGQAVAKITGTAGELVGKAVPAAAAGYRGVYDLARGRGINQAVEDVKSTTQDFGGEVSQATHSPLLGATAEVVAQSAPAALIPGARAVTRGIRAGAAEGEAAAAGARPAGGQATDVPRGTSGTQAKPEGPGRAQAQPPGQGQPKPQTAQEASQAPAGAQSEQEARAQQYARDIGLDWGRMGAGTRAALTTIAQDASALERLNPAAVRRQAHLQGLRVPVQATRGQLERDPVQLRREAIASNTPEGQPIRDVDIAANRDLQANLEVLRGRVGGQRGGFHEPLTEEGLPAEKPSIRAPTKTPTQVGEAAQGAAREKAKWSKKGYQALYKIARETEPDAKAGLKPIQDLLTSNPEIQHLGWVQSWLSKARSTLPKVEGETPPLEKVPLAELHDLRSTANDIARTGGKEGYYAGQVVKAIDQAMEDVPAGAKAWKAANEAFRKHQQEFKDQAIVGKLVNQKKGGADRSLALEKTWKTIATGPLDQIRQVKKTLLTGGTPSTRIAGKRAWRDIRAETVNRILEDARNVSSADETERAILTEAALRRSINRIPRENLEEILGKQNVRELYDILRARRIATRSPVGGRTTQSGTVPNALVLAEKVLKHIPGGKYVVGAKNAIRDLGERGAAERAAKEAAVSPLEQAARDVEKLSKRRAARAAIETLERGGPTLPPGPPSEPLPIGEALKRQVGPPP